MPFAKRCQAQGRRPLGLHRRGIRAGAAGARIPPGSVACEGPWRRRAPLRRGRTEGGRGRLSSRSRGRLAHARTPRRVPEPLEELTPRELDVLGLMAEGRSNQAIADALVTQDGPSRSTWPASSPNSICRRRPRTTAASSQCWPSYAASRPSTQLNRFCPHSALRLLCQRASGARLERLRRWNPRAAVTPACSRAPTSRGVARSPRRNARGYLVCDPELLQRELMPGNARVAIGLRAPAKRSCVLDVTVVEHQQHAAGLLLYPSFGIALARRAEPTPCPSAQRRGRPVGRPSLLGVCHSCEAIVRRSTRSTLC